MKHNCWFFLIAILALYLPSSAHAADSLRFKQFDSAIVYEHGGEPPLLRIACALENEDSIRTMLKDGAVLALTVDIAIEGHRSWWLNKSIEGQSFVSMLRHNPLTREYSITMPQPDGEVTIHDRNLTRLLHATWQKMSVPLFVPEVFASLDAGREYSITITLELTHAEAPPWLQNSMGFWSAEVIPAESQRLLFIAP